MAQPLVATSLGYGAVETQRLLDYGVTNLAQVEGWLSPLDFAVMTSILVAQANLPREGDLAEIGVWRGKSAILMSFFVSEGESLYAVDVFDTYYPGEAPVSPTKPYADPADFRHNLNAYGCPGAVTELASDTRSDDTLIERLSTREIRFFHIDGGHSYEHVIRDCQTALAVVGKECVIVLDDFMQIENPSVTEAIFDVFRGAPRGLVPFAITPKKLFLSNREDVPDYWRHLIALLPGAVTRKRPVLGASSLVLNPKRFDLSRDFQTSLLGSTGSPPSEIRQAIQRRSSTFPRIDEWLSEEPSLNANA